MDPDAFATLRERIRSALLAEAPAALEVTSRWERRVRVREAVARLLERDGLILSARDAARLVTEIADTIVGLGPLEQLMRDPAVTEVTCANRPYQLSWFPRQTRRLRGSQHSRGYLLSHL